MKHPQVILLRQICAVYSVVIDVTPSKVILTGLIYPFSSNSSLSIHTTRSLACFSPKGRRWYILIRVFSRQLNHRMMACTCSHLCVLLRHLANALEWSRKESRLRFGQTYSFYSSISSLISSHKSSTSSCNDSRSQSLGL